MFSSDSARQADACRFCWMCRHICPVAAATGNEAWTPRARGLMISMVERGAAFEESAADMMYKCALCDACANDCVTGYRPGDFIREARTEAVVQGLAPKKVMEALSNQEQTGRITGKAMDEKLEAYLKDIPEKGEVLLWLGETAPVSAPDTAIAAGELLRKAGKQVCVLKKEPQSGALMSELEGFTGDVQEAARAAEKAILATGAKTLVALDPHDGAFFAEHYKAWNLLSGVETVTATVYLASLVEAGTLSVKQTALAAAFHDPCRLTRGMEETKAARVLMDALGVTRTELFLNEKMTRCCGGPVLDFLSPEVTSPMAKMRIDDARRMGADRLITCCPGCRAILSAYGDMEILDLFVLLNENT